METYDRRFYTGHGVKLYPWRSVQVRWEGEPLHLFCVIAAPKPGMSLPPLLLDRARNAVGRRAFRKQQAHCTTRALRLQSADGRAVYEAPCSVVGAKEGEGIVSEATGGSGGRAEMKRRLIERSLRDESFRQRLLEDPKGAVEQELGTPVPEEVEVRAVEETPETVYLVLPPGTPPAGRGGEISDRDLEAVAGGDPWDGMTYTHRTTECVATHPERYAGLANLRTYSA